MPIKYVCEWKMLIDEINVFVIDIFNNQFPLPQHCFHPALFWKDEYKRYRNYVSYARRKNLLFSLTFFVQYHECAFD